MSLALCPQVVSQGPQHFRSLRRKPLVMVAFPASLSTWSFPLTPAWTGQYSMGVIRNGCQTLTHSSLGFPFHFTHFIASSLNLWGWWYVWSDLLRQSSRDHMWLLPLPLSSRRLRSCKAAQSSWMVVAPCLTMKVSWLVFDDWAVTMHYYILQFAVSLTVKFDLWISFAYWPFLTVPSQVFQYLIEVPESVGIHLLFLGLLWCW